MRGTRRTFIKATIGSGASLASTALWPAYGQAPAVITSERARPKIVSGIQIGDVTGGRAIVWSRADRPSRLLVDYAYREDFSGAVRVRGPAALETSDYTARVDLTDLAPDRQAFIRVTFEDLSTGSALSEPVTGRFLTPPLTRRDVTFAWSGDTAGQGWGINPEFGGMRCYETVRRDRPDFFIHVGDTIYADSPIAAEVKMDGGAVWKNIVTEEVSKVAETLKEFRGRYAYNLIDDNVRRMSAEVPQIWQWDDHEVLNNWSDSKNLSTDARYTEKSIRQIAARATKAFLEYAPLRPHSADDSERIYRKISYGPLLDVFVLDMRSYRSGNSYNRQTAAGPETTFLGPQQVAWLKQEMSRSTAIWKVVSADMPIGLVVGDGKDAQGRDRYEAIANGNGPALGREFEIADVLSHLKKQRTRNVIWITADVHYCAAHYYDPAKAQFTDFDPFWEFVGGPIHAGGYGPATIDNTFGPQVVFQKPPAKSGAAPANDTQFYGLVRIDGRSGAMKVALKNLGGATLFEKELSPERG